LDKWEPKCDFHQHEGRNAVEGQGDILPFLLRNLVDELVHQIMCREKLNKGLHRSYTGRKEVLTRVDGHFAKALECVSEVIVKVLLTLDHIVGIVVVVVYDQTWMRGTGSGEWANRLIKWMFSW
jgi:hypothetical protein